MPIINTKQFYSGGLAEIVDKPSKVTLAYLQKWFNTKASLGKALAFLHIPFIPTDISVLVSEHDELYVDLAAEERVLYKNTLLKYAQQQNVQDLPKLVLGWSKVLNPLCWLNTLKLIYTQSYWISKPTETYEKLETAVKSIPVYETADKETIEKMLLENIVPMVTAVGMVNEFYYQLLLNENKGEFENISLYINAQLKERDWFYASISEQQKVQSGKMTFANYMKKYGIRADRDYELTCPRWYEIPEEIAQRIKDYKKIVSSRVTPSLPSMSASHAKHIETYIDLLVLRSEVKKLFLIWIDLLRKCLVLTPEKVSVKNRAQTPELPSVKKHIDSTYKHKGLPISVGEVRGVVKIISSNRDTIEQSTIGVFPNSGTEFSALFPKCKGIIFLRGGQTSHGAIVAREFGVPALTDKLASDLKTGQTVSINGGSGEWRVIDLV